MKDYCCCASLHQQQQQQQQQILKVAKDENQILPVKKGHWRGGVQTVIRSQEIPLPLTGDNDMTADMGFLGLMVIQVRRDKGG